MYCLGYSYIPELACVRMSAPGRWRPVPSGEQTMLIPVPTYPLPWPAAAVSTQLQLGGCPRTPEAPWHWVGLVNRREPPAL